MTRDNKGRFTKGNPGGPGRPRKEIEEDYLASLTEAVSPDDWQAIVLKAVADAKQGDSRARDWLGKHLIGDQIKHIHSNDFSGLTTEELITEAQAILAEAEGAV